MRNFFEHHKGMVLLIGATLVIAILIGIFSALASGEKASLAEGAIEGVSTPGQAAVSGTGNWFSNLFGYFGSVKALRAENEVLKNSNIELDKRLRDAQGLEAENAELRTMLDLSKTEPELKLLAATVIAKDPSNWYGTFTINRGTDHGVQKGQPIITANKELVGKVSRVGSDWAEVVTVLDPECGVGALVERSKEVGVLEGDSSLRLRGRCRLGYLSRDADMEVGDYVETSGMGGVYPKGLLVGKILELKEDNTNMSKYAIVEPLVNFGNLHQVFVLRGSVEVVKKLDFDTSAKEDADNKDKSRQNKDEEDEETVTSKPTATPKPTASATKKPAATTKPSTTTGSSNSSGSTSGSSSSGSSGSTTSGGMSGGELRE